MSAKRAVFGLPIVLVISILLGISILLAACGQAAAPTPAPTPTPTKPAAAAPPPAPPATSAPPAGAAGTDVAQGKSAFDANCTGCHPGGGAGVGPAIKGKSQDEIKNKIRSGGGAMPAFGPSQLGDQQLNALAAYVNSLK